MRRNVLVFVVFFMLPFFCAAGSFAARPTPAVSPAVFQCMLKAAGADSEIIVPDRGTGDLCSIFIPDLRGSTVTIAFPSSGLRPGKPFQLEIDGVEATVTCTGEGKLLLVSGDERIVAAGIFGTLECLFSTVLTMLADVFDAILSFDILGVLEAIVSGILGVIICIIY